MFNLTSIAPHPRMFLQSQLYVPCHLITRKWPETAPDFIWTSACSGRRSFCSGPEVTLWCQMFAPSSDRIGISLLWVPLFGTVSCSPASMSTSKLCIALHSHYSISPAIIPCHWMMEFKIYACLILLQHWLQFPVISHCANEKLHSTNWCTNFGCYLHYFVHTWVITVTHCSTGWVVSTTDNIKLLATKDNP